jgi:hypothetical protein
MHPWTPRLRFVNSVGDAFGYAFRDPNWAGKMLLQGLIAIIPIIGWIAMTGWLMMAFENARSGRNELPPAGFHLERGIAIFLVFLIYGFVLYIPALILFAAGGIASSGSSNFFNQGSPLTSLGYLLNLAASLFLRFLVPSLIVHTYHGGFAGGMDVQRVWRLATVNVNNSIVAGLIVFVASIIGGLGFVCCIGFIFTIPYENTITAGAVAWFERMQASASAPPAPPATPPPLPGGASS